MLSPWLRRFDNLLYKGKQLDWVKKIERNHLAQFSLPEYKLKLLGNGLEIEPCLQTLLSGPSIPGKTDNR
jgi:hypothetical protein